MKNIKILTAVAAAFIMISLLFCACSSEKITESQSPVIRLGANATTGYSWFATEYDSASFIVVEADYESDTSGLNGAPGYAVFNIELLDGATPGDYNVSFLYYRPWEGVESAVRRADVTVTIKGNESVEVSEPVFTDIPVNSSDIY